MSNAQSAPSSPDIKQIHSDARALVRAHLRGDPSVCERIRKFSPRFAISSDAAILASNSSIIGAIEVVAREHGFESWHAAQEQDVGHKLLPGDASLEHLRKQSKQLLKALQAGHEKAVERARAHRSGGELTLNDAQFVIAREYGHASWHKLVSNFEKPEGRPVLNRPQLFAVERMHDEFARLLHEILERHVKEKVACETAFIDQTTYIELIHSLARPSCVCSFAMDVMRNRSVLDIAMPLVFLLLGKSEDEERWLTDEEQKRVEPVFRDVLTTLQNTWESVLPTVVSDMAIETDPLLVNVAEANSTVVLIAFEINTLERSGLVAISYPLLGGMYEMREHFK